MAAVRIQVTAVIVTAFEPDSGPVPGELRFWREREHLTETLAFPAGYRPLSFNPESGILAIVTGVGAARAAASIMALGLDPRFDLTQAWFLIAGVAGVSPARASLASIILPEYVIDGDLNHAIDAREIPAAWPDGYIPIGKSTPYEQPLEARFNGDDGIVFRLHAPLIEWAYALTRNATLQDTLAMATRRAQFEPAATAHNPPSVLRGDELSTSTFWHGALLSQRATRWVNYQTNGVADYAVTAMEDTGILQSLLFLAQASLVNLQRVLILRGASNFDQQRPGITAAESLAETKVVTYSAYLPTLENLHRVGHRILHALLAAWPQSPV